MEEVSEAEGEAEGEAGSRSYWRWAKSDFFPEPSFQSWRAYQAALSSTCPRLRDRVLHRSTSGSELGSLRAASENPLRRCLTWRDLALLGFGSVVGSGVFVLTGQEARFAAGPAIPLSYAAAGASALLSALTYAEFATEIPSAGGSFSYLRVELGDSVAFLAAANILLEAVVGAAGLARSWTSYFATLIGRHPNSLRIYAPGLSVGFNRLDPIAVAVLLGSSAVAVTGARIASNLNSIASVLGIVVIGFVIVAGSTRADVSNLEPFFPFGAQGVFRAAAVVYWSYTGFDMVATMAEETKNPSRDIPLGLITSMSAITLVYCAMSFVLVAMERYDRLDPDAAYSVAFSSTGMSWAKSLVALGALKGMTTGLLVGSLGQARYTTQIARSHMIPPYFALVHPTTATPIYAALLVTIPAACVAFFSSLDVLADVSSISTLFIFMLMAVALLIRRYYVANVTSAANFYKLISSITIIVISSIGLAVYWNSKYSNNWVGYAVAAPVWLTATLALAVFVPQQRKPKVWGVPLVPWLPSVSVAMNLFLMGSLEYQAYVRFGVCTLVMVVYYVLFGVHATYDMAHQQDDKVVELGSKGGI